MRSGRARNVVKVERYPTLAERARLAGAWPLQDCVLVEAIITFSHCHLARSLLQTGFLTRNSLHPAAAYADAVTLKDPLNATAGHSKSPQSAPLSPTSESYKA